MIWDSTTRQYQQGPKMATGRSDACGAAIDGKLYVAGGWTTNFESTLQSVEIFDSVSGKWSAGPPLPEPRCAKPKRKRNTHAMYYAFKNDCSGTTGSVALL
jgi:hypothetical protein